MNVARMFLAPAMIVAGLSIAGLSIVGCAPTPSAQEADTPGVNPDVVAAKVDAMKMVAHGANHGLFYKAPAAGRIYLFDNDSGRFIYRSRIKANGTFLFEPASSRAVLNKETVDLDFPSNAHDEYQLYFAPR